MNPDVAFEIVNLAVSLARALTTGKAQQDATLSGILLRHRKGRSGAPRSHWRNTGPVLDQA